MNIYVCYTFILIFKFILIYLLHVLFVLKMRSLLHFLNDKGKN